MQTDPPPVLDHLFNLLTATRIYTGLQIDKIPGRVRYREVYTTRCAFAYVAHYNMAARSCEIADAVVLSRPAVSDMLTRAEAVLHTGMDIGYCDHRVLSDMVIGIWETYTRELDSTGRAPSAYATRRHV